GRTAHDLADDGDAAVVSRKLARLERRRPPAESRRVEEEDREDGCDRQGDHEPRGISAASHGAECSPYPLVDSDDSPWDEGGPAETSRPTQEERACLKTREVHEN